MLAYLCGEPTKSKTESNEIFGNLYDEAFNPHIVTAEIVVAAHECHTEIEKLRKEALAWQASVTRNAFEETWIIEGHFHLLFVVGELMRRSGVSLDSTSIAISLISKGHEIITKYVERNRRVASYRLFRLSRSKEEILKIMDESSTAKGERPVQSDLFGY